MRAMWRTAKLPTSTIPAGKPYQGYTRADRSGLVPALDRSSQDSERLRSHRLAHLVSVVAYANGPMPEIIYFNGRRVAMGEDLEPIVLFDQAKPGDKVLVAVKLLHTVDQKHFAGAESAHRIHSVAPQSVELLAGNSVRRGADALARRGRAIRRSSSWKPPALLWISNALHQRRSAAFDASLEKAQALLNCSSRGCKDLRSPHRQFAH